MLGKREDGNPGVPDSCSSGRPSWTRSLESSRSWVTTRTIPNRTGGYCSQRPNTSRSSHGMDATMGESGSTRSSRHVRRSNPNCSTASGCKGECPSRGPRAPDSASPASNEADDQAGDDPLDYEDEAEGSMIPAVARRRHDAREAWARRLREDSLGQVITPYFRKDVVRGHLASPPLLARHHTELLSQLNDDARPVAGQVFRRILMAEEFLLRYLTGVPRETSEHWADYLAKRDDDKSLDGHNESLKDRVNAYLETLVRGRRIPCCSMGTRRPR